MKTYHISLGGRVTSIRQSTIDKARTKETKEGYPLCTGCTDAEWALSLACERVYGKEAFLWKDSRGIRVQAIQYGANGEDYYSVIFVPWAVTITE